MNEHKPHWKQWIGARAPCFGLSVVWPQFAALGLIGAVLFAISLAGFRRAVGALAH